MYSILTESFTVNWLIKLYNIILSSFDSSIFVNVFKRVATAIKLSFKNSVILCFFAREGVISGSWEESVTYKVLNWILFVPEKCIKAVYIKTENVLSGSTAYNVFLLAVKNLHYLIAGTIFIFLVSPFDIWHNQYATALILVLFALLLFKRAIFNEEGVLASSIYFYLFIFAVAVTAGLLLSISTHMSMRFFVFYINSFLLLLLVTGCMKTIIQLKQIIGIILVGVTITGLYGIWQAFVGVPVDASLTDVSANPDMPGRIFSTIGNSNDFAEVLVLLVPLFFAAIGYSNHWRKKILFTVLAIPPILALLLTYSRTSWIGMSTAVVIFILFTNWKLIIPLAIVGLFSIPLLPLSIITRVQTIFTGDSSIDYRLLIYKTVLPVYKDYWLKGIGLGTDVFKNVLSRYPTYTSLLPPHSHNLLLQIWAETGIVGILSFIGFLLYICKNAVRNIFKKVNTPVRYIIVASVAGVIGVTFTGMGEYVWHTHRVMLIYWAVIGILIAATNIYKVQTRDTGRE